MESRPDSEDAEVLKRVLTNYIGDLRMEIRDTEKLELREELKADERRLGEIVKKLG